MTTQEAEATKGFDPHLKFVLHAEETAKQDLTLCTTFNKREFDRSNSYIF